MVSDDDIPRLKGELADIARRMASDARYLLDRLEARRMLDQPTDGLETAEEHARWAATAIVALAESLKN